MYPLAVGLVIGNKDLWEQVRACFEELPVQVQMEATEIAEWPAFLEKLERMHPEVLLVDFTTVKEPFEEAIPKLKSVSSPPKVIAIHQAFDAETILSAVRAGADEYLYPPLKESLRKALERLAGNRTQLHAGARKGGKALGFLSAKGGCGATTIAVHTAVELARQTRQEVLLADFDMDAGLIGFLMKSRSRYSVLDALSNTHRLDLSYWKALVSNGMPGVTVIRAPFGAPVREMPGPEGLRHVLGFVRFHYDWTVADLGRGLNGLSMAALDEIDEAFLVTTLDVPALHQVKQTVQTLLDAGYGRSRLRLILNRVPKHPEVTASELEGVLEIPIYATLPNDYGALYESYAEGQLLPAASNLGRHMTRLASKIAGTPEQTGKRKFTLFG